jgi:hypothetical protein
MKAWLLERRANYGTQPCEQMAAHGVSVPDGSDSDRIDPRVWAGRRGMLDRVMPATASRDLRSNRAS